ncbi:hypothetical protein CBL_13577 [Carabus blaptoides fortunei]
MRDDNPPYHRMKTMVQKLASSALIRGRCQCFALHCQGHYCQTPVRDKLGARPPDGSASDAHGAPFRVACDRCDYRTRVARLSLTFNVATPKRIQQTAIGATIDEEINNTPYIPGNLCRESYKYNES